MIRIIRAVLWFLGLGRPREGDVYVSTYLGYGLVTVEVLAVTDDAAVVTITTLGGSGVDGLQAVSAGAWHSMVRTLRLRPRRDAA